jgi:hypothetical protein
MQALSKDPQSARLFLSGKRWQNGDTTNQSAKALFKYENRTDLTVVLHPLKAWFLPSWRAL